MVATHAPEAKSSDQPLSSPIRTSNNMPAPSRRSLNPFMAIPYDNARYIATGFRQDVAGIGYVTSPENEAGTFPCRIPWKGSAAGRHRAWKVPVLPVQRGYLEGHPAGT